MFKGLTGLPFAKVWMVPTFRPVMRFNSTLSQLSKAIKTSPARSTNKTVANDLDHLLLQDLNPQEANSKPNFNMGNSGSDYLLQQNVRHPRDVAKSIRVFGTEAGRSVDVRNGNLGMAIGNMRRIVTSNNIKHLQKIQSRHIRKAKLQKMKKARWWRNTFSRDFKKLMAEVRDATRRGY